MADAYHGPYVSDIDRIAKALGIVGNTLQSVHDNEVGAGKMSEYDFYLCVKGATILYPHVAQVVRDESIPPTERA